MAMKSKLVTLLISVAIALALWIYVITVVSPNSDKVFSDITVEVDDAILRERGLMVTNKDGHKVKLHIVGNRIDLNKLSRDNLNVFVDLSNVYTTGEHRMNYNVEFKDITQNPLDVKEGTPGTILLNVDEYVVKKVPVNVVYEGDIDRAKYKADDGKEDLEYREIQISGPGSVANLITSANVLINLDGRTESIDEKFPVVFYDMNGVVVDASRIESQANEVNVKLKIERYKNISLFVDIKDGGGATAGDCVVTMVPKEIMVTGSEKILEELEKWSVGEVDLSTIKDGDTISFEIKLPDGVTNINGNTETTVTINFPELETKELLVTQFVKSNEPQGKDVVIKKQVIKLTFRGPKEAIQKLTEDDVTVIVDCASLQEGVTNWIVPTIICKDSRIGAMGIIEEIPVELNDKSKQISENRIELS